MWHIRISALTISAACLGIAGCGTAPLEGRTRIIDVPLAAVNSSIAFTMTTGQRQSTGCAESTSCPTPEGMNAAMDFNLQVQRVAADLQIGAQSLYPDLVQRVPGLPGGRFDVYVVDGDTPGCASSSDGRIALNAALGARQPSDDWLAFVIAREMGHVIARHDEENWAASITTSVLMNILIPGSSLLKGVLSWGGSRIAAQSKREIQANEADTIAHELLASAGFHLRDVAQSLLSAPAISDDGEWSKRFQQSSESLFAKVFS